MEREWYIYIYIDMNWYDMTLHTYTQMILQHTSVLYTQFLERRWEKQKMLWQSCLVTSFLNLKVHSTSRTRDQGLECFGPLIFSFHAAGIQMGGAKRGSFSMSWAGTHRGTTGVVRADGRVEYDLKTILKLCSSCEVHTYTYLQTPKASKFWCHSGETVFFQNAAGIPVLRRFWKNVYHFVFLHIFAKKNMKLHGCKGAAQHYVGLNGVGSSFTAFGAWALWLLRWNPPCASVQPKLCTLGLEGACITQHFGLRPHPSDPPNFDLEWSLLLACQKFWKMEALWG